MDNKYLADLLFPDITLTMEDYEKKYPERNLKEGAKVTRIAPSPTGFMHLGNLFGAITDERLAHQSEGVFYLRIEDTDLKRQVEGGVETIIKVFNQFNLNFDEGVTLDGEKGDYGPYRQRQREKIYKTYAKQLVEIGLASANTYKALVGKEPRVAFLSYSTKGSAGGELVEKVQRAVELARPRFAEAGIAMDGEVQLDTALVPVVAELKNKDGVIKGDANVLIFPDLQAGNIGYKIAQRIGGAVAIGPNLQGLAKAMNDLSRGCTAEEIVGTICVTLLQSADKR